MKDKLIRCAVLWADNCWIMSHSKTRLDQMMKDLNDEAEGRNLEPKPPSLWRTSTCVSEMTEDITICTRTGRHRKPFERSFRIFGLHLNQAGKTQSCLEERMQDASMAWWRDHDLQKQRCTVEKKKWRRMVEHVCSAFCCGSENRSWSQPILDRMKGLKAKAVRRLFRFKKKEDENITEFLVSRNCKRQDQFGQG